MLKKNVELNIVTFSIFKNLNLDENCKNHDILHTIFQFFNHKLSKTYFIELRSELFLVFLLAMIYHIQLPTYPNYFTYNRNYENLHHIPLTHLRQ